MKFKTNYLYCSGLEKSLEVLVFYLFILLFKIIPLSYADSPQTFRTELTKLNRIICVTKQNYLLFVFLTESRTDVESNETNEPLRNIDDSNGDVS